ncbi:MAG: folylpolyglutamate synthase/dihydrofolate synthase family protein [Candidatus Omnitrophota bacterium]
MTYNDAIKYLNTFYDYERALSPVSYALNLERIERLVRIFGVPQTSYGTVHITGTKGKGSTAHILSSILTEAGYRVGLFTSPHISDIRERIRVNNKMIEKRDFAALVGELKREMKGLGRSLRPTYFELLTMLAFNHFADKLIDLGIFEVGLGGRLDATNVVMPVACGITPISLDHTSELGRDVISIAKEKAEIIKAGSECASAFQEKGVMRVIGNKCIREGVRLHFVGRDITARIKSCSDRGEVFDVKGLAGVYRNLALPLMGEHQVSNASLAIALAETIAKKGYNITESSISDGIRNVSLSARCEILSRGPIVLLDGAHNRAGMLALAKTIRRNLKFRKSVFILGISANKDIKGICEEVAGIADTVIVTKADTARAAAPERIARHLKSVKVIIARDLKQARAVSRPFVLKDDLIVITGSFYLAGAAKKLFTTK